MTEPQPTVARFLIVAPTDSVPLVNDTIRNVDPQSVGDPLQTKLRLASSNTNTEVACWGSWAMPADVRDNFKRAVREAGWQPKPNAAEQSVYSLDGTPMTDGTPTLPLSSAPAWGSGSRVWVFDGDRVPTQTVLDLLTLARFRPLI